ncbi:hypothetical protein NECAME_07522 [Necator americanus]|uniref:7TM GPCR serpentine receptor class x (Srx) domain-containing protein n=1 Tax=Necator americanus TaxID=51031 RepID=W2TQ54_NECAM|nr:hypothetical protein NECAME_07522 [Necator americanus]ETN83162.1 hypothetical protein NECAME_07522 [Necator americanus]
MPAHVTPNALKTRKTSSSMTRKHEIKIFLQSTFLCVYIMTLIIMWHNAESWFVMTNVTIAILNGAWICFPYLNPMLLVALNKYVQWTIRKKVLQVLRGRTESTTKISVTTTNKQFSRR